MVELGCGLIAIGRQWGTTPEVPSEAGAITFLQGAYDAGVRFFDTAPSYGLSEERLGIFLRSLTPEQRRGVRVATKFGEHWDSQERTVYADHSLDALKRSFDQSRSRLGEIVILQLHKTTPALLKSPVIAEAFNYALANGAKQIGVSVSDSVSAEIALTDDRFSVVQLPYNPASPQFHDAVASACEHGKELLINRPLQMGNITAATQDSESKQAAVVSAFRFILQEEFDGVILTGTANLGHLQENMAAFTAAQQ
ncbi:MAG TPA: aldo/keto reductase [Candidatus Saccharimonadales bacterium]|nr:aldo/keto reductase [Candidatus Saccharimonadales bacterium]